MSHVTARSAFHTATLGGIFGSQFIPGADWLWMVSAAGGVGSAGTEWANHASQSRLATERREGMRRALEMARGKIEELAIGNRDQTWSPSQIGLFQRHVVESAQNLAVAAGLVSARVCLYKLSRPEGADPSASTEEVDVTLDYAYHHPQTGMPTQQFKRNDTEASGMFAAVNDLKTTAEPDRPGYSRELCTWRAAVRAPIYLDRARWGVITMDSPDTGWTEEPAHLRIIELAAGLIAAARSSEDKGKSREETIDSLLDNYADTIQEQPENGGGANHD